MAQTNVQAFSGDVEISSNLAVNTDDLFVDTESGRVGIGTTNPATPFNINKLTATINPKAHTTTEFIRLRGDKVIGETYAISGGIKLGGDTDGTATADGRIEFYANDGANAGNSYGDIPDNFVMCIRGDGRVGIGTTNPSDSLHVMGAISTQNGGNPAVTPAVLFRSGANNTNSWEMKTNVSDSFAGDFTIDRLDAATKQKFVIRNNGNIGIGTTNPYQGNLTVYALGADPYFSGYVQGGYADATDFTGLAHFKSSGSHGVIRVSNSADNTGTTRIDFNTRLGGYWGTNTALSSYFRGTAPTAGRIMVGGEIDSNYEDSYMTFHTCRDLRTDGIGGTGNLYERMRITSTGNVGIGTANPTTVLQISRNFTASGDTSAMISFENTGSGYYDWQIGPTVFAGSAGFAIKGGADGFGNLSNIFVINDKYVGIGTDNPSAKLQVGGNAETGPQYLWIRGNRINEAGEIAGIHFYNSLNSGDRGNSRIISSRGTNNYGSNLAFWTNPDSNVPALERMRILANGNVGIGTTNPGSKLEVYGGEGIRSRNADNTVAKLSAYGVSQGTGLLYVGQSNDFGGGIEYNGDNDPISTGAGADYTALYRLQASSFYWTARNYVTGNQWEFRVAIDNTSDDRVKENETYIRGATDTLMKIKPQIYDKKPSIESTDTKEWLCESGLIAQELYYDVPELRHLVKIPRDARDIDTNVSITSDDPTVDPDYSAWGKDTSAVNYTGLIPYLIKSVQEITTELPRHKTPVSNITPQNVNDFVGLILSKRGTVELSTKSEDKACYGVISEITCDTQNNEILVNSSGEGKIWVTNLTGNVEAGDLITTSNIAGYGQLQNSPVLSNFTVAKLTEDCDFNPSSTPVRRIRQEMSNVTVYSVSREVRVTEEEYNELAEEDRTTENRITYFDGDTQLTFDEYSNSESNTLRTETTLVFKLIHRHTSRTMREGYTPEVRQELVNVLDEHGQLVWEDSEEMESVYKIRYLDADGNITDEANAVHKAALVGCTYHCG